MAAHKLVSRQYCRPLHSLAVQRRQELEAAGMSPHEAQGILVAGCRITLFAHVFHEASSSGDRSHREAPGRVGGRLQDTCGEVVLHLRSPT